MGPDGTILRTDFPFVKVVEGQGTQNSNDIAGSMGMFLTLFQGTNAGQQVDNGTRLNDPVFNLNGRTTRRVEPRNTPTMINAVFNFANFWDGRANNIFNGVSPFGQQDLDAAVFVVQANGTLVTQKIALANASLASQSVGPPLNPFEMSFGDPSQNNARTFAEIGKKLLRGINPLTPLGKQLVDKTDSVLGSLSNFPARGINANYRQLVEQAFDPKFWRYTGTVNLTSTTLYPVGTGTDRIPDPSYTINPPSNSTVGDKVFTQMEVNFSLFFGLAVMTYEATLVADATPFDHWMETGSLNGAFNADALAGLNLIVNEGQCINCHGGPEFTKASVRNAQNGKNVIEPMTMAKGTALYDNGFYNISVVPTTDDLGRGYVDAQNNVRPEQGSSRYDRIWARRRNRWWTRLMEVGCN